MKWKQLKGVKVKPFSIDVTLEHEKGWRLGPPCLVSSISLHNNKVILTLDYFSLTLVNFNPRVNDPCNSGSSENPGLFGKKLKGD